MANFNTHLAWAATISTAAAATLAATETLEPTQAVGAATLGTIGGLLPDIDLHYSKPTRHFRKAAVLIGLAATLVTHNPQTPQQSTWLAITVTAVPFLMFGWGKTKGLIHRLTKHRGIIHSIPAAFTAGLATAIIAIQTLTTSQAIWAGVFMFAGFMTHLILDEIYSVDLVGRRVKKSFGTAVCLGNPKSAVSTGLIWLIAFALFFWFTILAVLAL